MNTMFSAIFVFFFLCPMVSATPLSDFCDTLSPGIWVSFPTPALDQQAMLRTGTGNIFNYADNAVWDTASQKLYFLGICHPRDGSELKGVLYDANANQWRKAAVPAGPITYCFANGWCIPHTYDQLTMDDANRCAYFINSTGSAAHFFRFTFATETWDTIYVTYPGGSQLPGHYLYAGAMELFPDINTFIMFSGDYGNKGAYLDRGVNPWAWKDYPAGGMFCFYHTLLVYNPSYRSMMGLGCNQCGIINTQKVLTLIDQPPVNVHVANTKASVEPVTGATMILQDDAQSRVLFYDPRGDKWHECPINPPGILDQGYEAGSSVSFTMRDHGVVGVLRYTAPYFLLYKYAPRADSVAPSGLAVYASDTAFERFLATSLTVVALRAGGARDTVTTSSYFYSLDTTLAVVEPGGVIRATGNGTGPVQIEVARNTGTWQIKDTITLAVTASTAILDSLKVAPGALSVLAGDSYPLNVTGYYHKGAAFFSRRIDTSGIWFSGNAAASVSATGVVTGAAAGIAPVYARIGSLSDTALVKVMPKPSFLKRINFQVSPTPWSYGWLADNGAAFSAAADYGWVGASGLSSRDDRVGSANFLLKSFVSTSSRTQYRVALPDGDYIIKLAMGDNQYGSTDTAWFGTQVVLAHTGVSNGIAVDTVTVTGGAGLVLTVKGVFNYLVVISREGIDINAVADDNGTAVPVPPAGSEVRVRAVSVPLLSVYPNPARGVVMIRTPLKGGLNLAVYNVRGKKVADLGSLAWNTSGVSAGIYLVKLTQGKKTYCARLALMK